MHNRILGVTSDGIINYIPEGAIGGKAFHSIYFEVLGEQGFPGFIMYFSMIVLTLLKLHSLKKKWRKHEGMAWMVTLADALTTGILIFLAGGAFVGIAYQPFIFYLVSLTVAMDQYTVRIEKEALKEKRLMEAKNRAIAQQHPVNI